ncbi:MAG: efflux transporter outer membrane subunit [Candidatus Binatia bacterium]|nr:efflux transporter outer membrane subunit [Candidatus Binatia bacterium]
MIQSIKQGAFALGALLLAGCPMIGPDFVKPDAPVAPDWKVRPDAHVEVKTGEQGQAEAEALDYAAWWKSFGDPTLDQLVEKAYRENRSLRIAGLRIVQAQARRGVAIGGLFPQSQSAGFGYQRTKLSENQLQDLSQVIGSGFSTWGLGFDAAWEVDLWGRFRRNVESADAELVAALATYDDVLVSLVSEVAVTYIGVRTLQELLVVARTNESIQARSLQIAQGRFDNGFVSELDVVQAKTLLRETQASIPGLQANLEQAQNSLAVLLGMPPQALGDLLGAPKPIPATSQKLVVGIPADLLRRRPDIRRAERAVAAQSARIGVALGDLYPSLSLVGQIGLAANSFGQIWEGNSLEAFGGPSLRWNILNYGQIRNNVRVQDALFQEQIVAYENTVLLAQQEVENSIAGYLGATAQVGYLTEGTVAAQRAVRLSELRYKEGESDYIRVLDAQRALLRSQELLVVTRGSIGVELIAVYKALGGGWELRDGQPFVPTEMSAEMKQRTNWGDLLDTVDQDEQIGEAEEKDPTGWSWPLW